MKNVSFIIFLLTIGLTLVASCKKEDKNYAPNGPAISGEDFKFYTDGTLRDADSVVAQHFTGQIVFSYFSSNTAPFDFMGTLSFPDTIEEGKNYPFNETAALVYWNASMPDGHYYKSVSGIYSITAYNSALGRVEVNFYGTLDAFDADGNETGEHMSVSNGHTVGFY